MNLIEKQANGLVLAQGIGLEQINAASLTLVKSVKDLGKRADHIMLAHTVHLINNEHFQKGGKGNTDPVANWVHQVWMSNKTWATAFTRFFRDVTGFEIKIQLKDDDQPELGSEVVVDPVDKRDFGKIREVIGEKLIAAYNNGITQEVELKYSRQKAAKKSKKGSGKGSGTVPDAPIVPVSIGLKLAEETGIMAALEAVEGSKQQENLKNVGAEVATLIAYILQHPNHTQVRDMIVATNRKLGERFQLGSVAKKAVV